MQKRRNAAVETVLSMFTILLQGDVTRVKINSTLQKFLPGN